MRVPEYADINAHEKGHEYDKKTASFAFRQDLLADHLPAVEEDKEGTGSQAW